MCACRCVLVCARACICACACVSFVRESVCLGSWGILEWGETPVGFAADVLNQMCALTQVCSDAVKRVVSGAKRS